MPEVVKGLGFTKLSFTCYISGNCSDCVSLRRGSGCPSSVTDENLYVYLVNASLNKIYNDVVITDTGSIYAHGITPNSVIEEKHHPPGADITIPIVGKAYSMRVCGERAEILVGAGQQTSKLVLTENPTVLKGFTVNGMAVISLLGDYAYSVFDICCYDQLLSVNVADIPDGSYYTSYDVEKRYPGFSSFALANKFIFFPFIYKIY